MDLTTRCPRCGTAFQASLADLQLRKGYIRCVQCAHIFDGYAEVVSAPDDPASAAGAVLKPASVAAKPPTAAHAPVHTVSMTPAPGGALPVHTMPPASGGALSVHTIPPDPVSPATPVPDARSMGEAPVFDTEDGPRVFRAGRGAAADALPEVPAWRIEPQINPERELEHGPSESIVVEARPGYRSQGGSAAPLLQSAQGPSWWDRLLRLLASLLLLVLLLLAAAQLAYVYRVQLAQVVPALRPWLLQACGPLRCQVPYARNLGEIAITGSALKIQDPLATGVPDAASATPGDATPADARSSADQHYLLQATLRNQAAYPQEWPSLILDLKDAAGTLLVRRNLAPVDYLGAEVAGQPLPARSDVQVRLPFTLSGLKINGYQIDLFYP
ncbi:DUF3426 domain-containing protein [Castellaniella hirudinis]|uniref:DUF3426 domain-containing protein n=1 Tax=Castellaniella hirudinis TaxID=1144617 RepID=UPI0039C11942